MELSEKAKRRLRRLSDCLQVEESEILDKAIESFYKKEIGKALRAGAKAQRKYYEEHPEEIEFMMRIQGIID